MAIRFVERTKSDGSKEWSRFVIWRNGRKVSLCDELVYALLIVERVFRSRGIEHVDISSGVEGTHSRKSAHYSGRAVDIRVWAIPEHLRDEIADQVEDEVGPDFDLVWGSAQGHSTHYHLEFDPKGPADGIDPAGVLA